MRTGEPAYSAVMSQSDPTAMLAEMKRIEALLRDARSVLRRVDALAAKASTSDGSEPRAHCRGAVRPYASSVGLRLLYGRVRPPRPADLQVALHKIHYRAQVMNYHRPRSVDSRDGQRSEMRLSAC